jgi:hypothetical protein
MTQSPIVELRQYITHPGRRDELIALFEREFIEPQEAVGVTVIGTFRDLDRPDRFVWMRGFPDPETRARALDAFYTGAVWRAHREAANATLLDNDDVLQLAPAADAAGFRLPGARAPVGSSGPGKGLVVASLAHVADADEAGFAAVFDRDCAPLLAAHGLAPIARFVVDHRPNAFPRLPVREGEHAYVWFCAFDSASAHARAARALAASPAWSDVWDRLKLRLGRPLET